MGTTWSTVFVLLKLIFCSGVPTEVDNYHSLFPLESLPPPNRLQKTSNFSYVTSCYKAVNSKDDLPYCLRRIHGEWIWNLPSKLRLKWKLYMPSTFSEYYFVFIYYVFCCPWLVICYACLRILNAGCEKHVPGVYSAFIPTGIWILTLPSAMHSNFFFEHQIHFANAFSLCANCCPESKFVIQ